MVEKTIHDLLSVDVDSLETKTLNSTAVFSLKSTGPSGEIIFDSTEATIPGTLNTTASLAATSSYVNTLNQNVEINGNLSVTGVTYLHNVVIDTASYSSGSTIFGDSLSDTHQFTGSVFVTGSSFLWNNNTVIASNITSSMSVLNAQTASFISGGTF